MLFLAPCGFAKFAKAEEAISPVPTARRANDGQRLSESEQSTDLAWWVDFPEDTGVNVDGTCVAKEDWTISMLESVGTSTIERCALPKARHRLGGVSLGLSRYQSADSDFYRQGSVFLRFPFAQSFALLSEVLLEGTNKSSRATLQLLPQMYFAEKQDQFRPYIIAGPIAGISLTEKAEATLGVSAGAGVDFWLNSAAMAFEIKTSFDFEALDSSPARSALAFTLRLYL